MTMHETEICMMMLEVMESMILVSIMELVSLPSDGRNTPTP